eukprot:SAG31_NODE_12223_length_957_cov_3.039627_1_plen_99_part_10
MRRSGQAQAQPAGVYLRRLGKYHALLATPAMATNAAVGAASSKAVAEKIIDAHVHFYDTRRPEHSGLGSKDHPILPPVCMSKECQAVCSGERVTGVVLV